VNWHKTKVQALGSRENELSAITVLGQEVSVVKNLFILALLSTQQLQSSPDISHHNAMVWLC